MRKKLFIGMAIFFSCVMAGCSSHATSDNDSSSKNLVEQTYANVDSIPLDFPFNLFRWNISDSVIWVVDARQDPFLTGVSTKSFHKIYEGGTIGQGPDDFISPGIVEGQTHGPEIYGITDNKIVSYQLEGDSLHPVSYGKFPLLENRGTLPNCYTRVVKITDSILAGTYFYPRYIGVDILDPTKGTLLSTLTMPFEQTGETMSTPYELKVASSDSILVTAYRYLDLIGLYTVDSSGNASLFKSIGTADNPQTERFENDDDDNAIKYYSDVDCANGMAFLLFQGVSEANLSEVSTALHVYSLKSGENLLNISLGRYFDQLLVSPDAKNIYLHTPYNEDYLFTIPISKHIPVI